MPVCFQLFRKSAPKDGPVSLTVIDAEMCAFFNVPCDSRRWYNGWYDAVGFNLACGKTFAEVRAAYVQYVSVGNDEYDKTMVRIVDWLNANFTADSFYQQKTPKPPEPKPAPEPEKAKSPAELHRIANALLRGHDHNGRATSGQHPRHWGRKSA